MTAEPTATIVPARSCLGKASSACGILRRGGAGTATPLSVPRPPVQTGRPNAYEDLVVRDLRGADPGNPKHIGGTYASCTMARMVSSAGTGAFSPLLIAASCVQIPSGGFLSNMLETNHVAFEPFTMTLEAPTAQTPRPFQARRRVATNAPVLAITTK